MQILPFQFKRLHDDKYLLVNECGEHIFLNQKEFQAICHETLTRNDCIFDDLKSKHFICENNKDDLIDILALKYRTRKRFISNFTVLHMMVLTLRCTNNCTYCQVAAEGEDAKKLDMSLSTARKIIEFISECPSEYIKIEFQGGEPTLNWETLAESVRYTKEIFPKKGKKVDFVVCTNLATLNENQITFFKEHKINISTSLDGPKNIHNKNRVLRNNEGTYDKFIENLQSCRELVGHDSVSALMTTTRDNINNLNSVVDEYIEKGFGGIFIRPLNPYGQANKNTANLGYTMEEFVYEYEKALDYIIDYNLRTGRLFPEYYATLLLTRILTPFSTGFVDLQSPSGAGISGIIYDQNGNVFPSDEARMLSRMGDDYFLMGNINKDKWLNIFGESILKEITNNSCLEIMPYCAYCVYQAYCGSDPIRNYLQTKDIIGKRPDNGFCTKNKLIFDLLFKKIKQNNSDVMDVLWSWITSRSLSKIRPTFEKV
jgi:uncharacterized protein